MRERCENRDLEFRETYRAALEREEALPIQAELLMPYDAALARLKDKSVLITSMMLRTENGFSDRKTLIKIESRNAIGVCSLMFMELDTPIVKKWSSGRHGESRCLPAERHAANDLEKAL